MLESAGPTKEVSARAHVAFEREADSENKGEVDNEDRAINQSEVNWLHRMSIVSSAGLNVTPYVRVTGDARPLTRHQRYLKTNKMTGESEKDSDDTTAGKIEMDVGRVTSKTLQKKREYPIGGRHNRSGRLRSRPSSRWRRHKHQGRLRPANAKLP